MFRRARHLWFVVIPLVAAFLLLRSARPRLAARRPPSALVRAVPTMAPPSRPMLAPIVPVDVLVRPSAPPRTEPCPRGVEVPEGNVIFYSSLDGEHGLTARVSAVCVDEEEVTVADFRRWWTGENHRVQEGDWHLRCTAPGICDLCVAYPGDQSACGGPLPHPARSHYQDLHAPRAGGYCTWTAEPGPNEMTPINCVDRHTAQAYCLSRMGRLLTEAEWLRAARGDSARTWPWGDSFEAESLCFSGLRRREGVCREPFENFADISFFGCRSMGGSLSEWMADGWDEEFPDSTDDPLRSPEGVQGVVRGGSWSSTSPQSLKVTERRPLDPWAMRFNVGFRCAYTPRSATMTASL